MKALKVMVPVLLVLAFAACAKPPQADIDAARAAVAGAAKNADIVSYAPGTLKSAQDKLAQMDAELAARRYDKVKTLAQDAKALATTAASDAVKNKDKANADATALIDALKKALPGADAKVATARKIAGIKLDFKAISAQLAEAKAVIADAEKDLAAGNFASALQKATAAETQLNDGEKAIADAVRTATSRKK